jgi:hypothetical protein
MQCNVIQE